MPTVLVSQLHFARNEFQRCLVGVSLEEGLQRIGQFNSIGWIVGHMANQEHFYWVRLATGQNLLPDLNQLVGTGKPASTPPLDEMWEAWFTATKVADTFLGTLTHEDLDTHFEFRGKMIGESVGTLLLRNLYHYWFHLGEAHAIRQAMGHKDLPQFVGDLSTVLYR